MPTYEYKCKECGIVFDRFQHFSEAPLSDCPECSGTVRRVIQPVGIIFKGSGFYVTDNKRDTSSLMPKSDAETTKPDGSKETTSGAAEADTQPTPKPADKAARAAKAAKDD